MSNLHSGKDAINIVSTIWIFTNHLGLLYYPLKPIGLLDNICPYESNTTRLGGN